MLEPVDVTVKTLKGDDRVFVISKFPAIAGREIIAKYPLTAIPKASDYSQNEEIMLKLMTYVGIRMPNGIILQLTTRALVDNHVPDYETLVRIELEMMKYNTSFFANGVASSFLTNTVQKLLASAAPMLTPLLQQLSQAVKRRSKN